MVKVNPTNMGYKTSNTLLKNVIIYRERERESLLPHLRWEGSFLPQPSAIFLICFGLIMAAMAGVTLGQTHSRWVTLTNAQHAGDGCWPITTPMHPLIPCWSSSWHWLGLTSSARDMEIITTITIKIHEGRRFTFIVSVILLQLGYTRTRILNHRGHHAYL